MGGRRLAELTPASAAVNGSNVLMALVAERRYTILIHSRARRERRCRGLAAAGAAHAGVRRTVYSYRPRASSMADSLPRCFGGRLSAHVQRSHTELSTGAGSAAPSSVTADSLAICVQGAERRA